VLAPSGTFHDLLLANTPNFLGIVS
jgi:hypothetical protein